MSPSFPFPFSYCQATVCMCMPAGAPDLGALPGGRTLRRRGNRVRADKPIAICRGTAASLPDWQASPTV